MIKAIIIDDEPSAVNTLRLMLERYVPEITDLQTTNSPLEGLQIVRSFKPQLIFLDIQMPQLSGLDMLKRLAPIDFDIIFTTASDQYAIQAIRFSALDYLLKPIDADELRTAVDRFLKRESARVPHDLYNNLLHNINAGNSTDFKLAIPTNDGTYFFLPADIIRLEGEGNYTNFYFTNRKNILTSRTLKEYEEMLTEHGFIRIHKSHLINKRHVLSFNAEGWLQMIDKAIVEVSRRRKDEVKEALLNNKPK